LSFPKFVFTARFGARYQSSDTLHKLFQTTTSLEGR